MSLLIQSYLGRLISSHNISTKNQQIIRHPCKTKVFCPFFHFLKIYRSLFNHFYCSINIKHSRTDHIKNSLSRIGAKIWNSIPNSDRALPKYKFKNTLQRRLLDILIQEDTYVGVRTLIGIFSKYKIFSLISFIPCFIYLFWNTCIHCLLNSICWCSCICLTLLCLNPIIVTFFTFPSCLDQL